MEAILTLLSSAGFVGSVALLGWGFVLCLTHSLDTGERAHADARRLNTNLPAGTLS